MKENKVYHSVIRVPKENAAFIYFQLEANDGLCFYSTLDFEKGDPNRELKISCDSSLKDEVKRLLDKLSQTINIEFLSKEEVTY